MLIKAGYRLTVVSWENDADNYNTVTVDGLTEDECKFKVAIAKLICGYNELSNMYEPSDSEYKKFEDAAKKTIMPFVGQLKYLGYCFDDEGCFGDIAHDVLYDLCGAGGENRYTRVIEKLTIEYVPEDIDLEDVTDKFLKG